jgi:ribosomal protein L27
LIQTGCDHPKSMGTPVSTGQIILVRQGGTNAAFVTYNGKANPEGTDYRWYMRSDGKTTFDPKDPAVTTGTGKGSLRIVFGPFNIEWSISSPPSGYVYYEEQYWFVTPRWCIPKSSSMAMAITSETDITKIDARDKKWKFKTRP